MDILYAPWRREYVTNVEKMKGCFLCAEARGAGKKSSLVAYKNERTFVILNRFPYNAGHVMVAPNVHTGKLESLNAETTAELWSMMVIVKRGLEHILRPHGFNIGINLGRVAGAGLPGHVHIHIVPRWNGDTNFMPVVGGVKVISLSLMDLKHKLKTFIRKYKTAE